MAQILVTGAGGFIGRHLVPLLLARGYRVVEAGRKPHSPGAGFAAVGRVGPQTDWRQALAGAEAVVHLAGLAHRDAEPAEFFAVNDAGTRRLLEACAAAGVGAVVALGSIAAREAARAPGTALPYGRSKLAAEAHMRHFAEAGRPGIVLRPPLVYGHDAPGNWRRLQGLAASGLPLPFRAVANRRSLCSVDNLCHAVLAAVEAGLRGAGSGTYEIADRETLSLAEIVALIRKGMGRPGRLVPVPPALLRLGGRLSGKGRLVAALLDDLTADPADFMRTFGWSPPETAHSAIMRSGGLYLSRP